MPSLSRFLCCGRSKPTTQIIRRSSITKYDDVRNPLLSKRDEKIIQLERQIKSSATNGEEMEGLRQELSQLRMEKDLVARTAVELRQEWSRDKERLMVVHRERDELSQNCLISVAKIAELQVQMEANKNMLLALQEERTRMQEQILADEIARNQSSSGEKAFDDAVDQLLNDLMTAKQEAQATAAGLADRIKLDENDITMLRGQLECLSEAKDTAEARVVELEAALDAELQAHETVILSTHEAHQAELQERIFCYQEEILEMRTQVSNIRASKLAADRCISDLETELDRARRDGEIGQMRVKELEASIALHEYTAAVTLKQQQQQQQQQLLLPQLQQQTMDHMNTNTPVSKTMDDDGTVTPAPWTTTSMGSAGSDATDIMTPAGKPAPSTHTKPLRQQQQERTVVGVGKPAGCDDANIGVPLSEQHDHIPSKTNITPKKHVPASPRGSTPSSTPTSNFKSHATKNNGYISPQKMVYSPSSSSSVRKGVSNDGNGSTETDDHDHVSRDEMNEMQLETVIARLEGQIVALEGEVTKEMVLNHTYTQQMNRLQSDYEARISDLENRLFLSFDDNANLQKFLVEITEAMEKTSQQPLMAMLSAAAAASGSGISSVGNK